MFQAYRDWLSGDAARYKQQQLARTAQVRAAAPTTTPLRLDPLRTRPVSLFYVDLTDNPAEWSNVAYSAFWRCPPVYAAEIIN